MKQTNLPFLIAVARDAIAVALVNCGTSVFAGFAIFAMIGFMAHELNVPIETATASGMDMHSLSSSPLSVGIHDID